MTEATVPAVPEVQDQLPTHDAGSRRKAVLAGIGLLVYLYVIFGLLLPSVIDYQQVWAAIQAAAPQQLLVVLVIGMLAWGAEGMALRTVFPGLGRWRATKGYLVMAAVGSTLMGPVKMAVGYLLFREWSYTPEQTVLGLTVNGLGAQVSKLLLPAIAIWGLTVTGTFPGYGFLVGFLLMLPVALGIVLVVWILRSEAFARRVGAFATRASGAVMRRMHRSAPDDLTDRVLDFRTSAAGVLRRRGAQNVSWQLLAGALGFVLMVASMRAVGVPDSVLPTDVILAVYAVVMVITLLPIAPGGAGVPEVLYISLFTRYVDDPAWANPVGAGVMLMRAVSWLLPIPVGYLLLFRERRSLRSGLARAGATGREAEPAGADEASAADAAADGQGAPAGAGTGGSETA